MKTSMWEQASAYARAARNGIGQAYGRRYQKRIESAWLDGFRGENQWRHSTNFDAPLRDAWQDGRAQRMRAGGFTLIEIIIAIVLIGLLATIAVPRYQAHKRRAFLTTAQVELKILQQTQEMYFVDASTYALTLAQLDDFQASAKIPIVLVESTGMGWAATATYENTTVRCAIFYGTVAVVPPPATALDEGVPVCTY